ncbi:hypothetical protein L1987_29463 [Smallanthus sonchifolius]|uniref:Uncharacterized protein n=1 Tax=Smallanthus sonchifolius TaxID=185202 RepID=A0ACB9I015_9ASTR|nr:hypothetical protein L1987_29463 [Smallanthus sonchifolius]
MLSYCIVQICSCDSAFRLISFEIFTIELVRYKLDSFYNILICDDPEYAKELVQEVFTHREMSFGSISSQRSSIVLLHLPEHHHKEVYCLCTRKD